MDINVLTWLVPAFPLAAFFLIILFTNHSNRISHTVALIGAGLSWLACMVIFVQALAAKDLAKTPFASAISWLPTGNTSFKIGVQVDPLTTVTLFFVAWTVLMIFIYSVAYHNYGAPKGENDHPGLPPQGATEKAKGSVKKSGGGKVHMVPSVEPMYSRFFALISLFAFAMFTLVVSDNLLTLYVGWEIMGFCSYMLIGFWYAKPAARDAAVKAFLTTRLGDVFMLLGLAALYSVTGSLSYNVIFANPDLLMASSGILGMSKGGLIGLLLFMGVIGKSAQFPLHVWLPDAMEGPTPVSAMIHAATMVSAGIYLALRFFPLASMGWVPGGPLTATMTVMAVIGTFTAIFAASIALGQNDIKRVLAYSTISQLGFMIAALGVGAYVAAAFHLVTHAFFKALLFLGSGSVIHGVEHGAMHTGEHVDPQDMFNMGGLREKMPVTFWTFLIGGFALSGFPIITAGFWSKDSILADAFNNGLYVVFGVLALAALLTAFYTMRQITLTFLGQARTKSAEHARESKWVMLLPLVVLAVFAVGFGWVGIPAAFPLLGGLAPNWFGSFVGSMLAEGGAPTEGNSLVPLLTSLVVSLGGLYLGWLVYRDVKTGELDPFQKVMPGVHKILKNKYYFDEAYAFLFVRPARWISETFSYQWIDKGVIDGILHFFARSAWVIGTVFRSGIDTPVINGAGDALSSGTRGLGGVLRRAQTGRIQQYMIIAVLLVVVVGAIFYSFLALVP
jgi:NADH-quinone oxidoreductase subunit L